MSPFPTSSSHAVCALAPHPAKLDLAPRFLERQRPVCLLAPGTPPPTLHPQSMCLIERLKTGRFMPPSRYPGRRFLLPAHLLLCGRFALLGKPFRGRFGSPSDFRSRRFLFPSSLMGSLLVLPNLLLRLLLACLNILRFDGVTRCLAPGRHFPQPTSMIWCKP